MAPSPFLLTSSHTNGRAIVFVQAVDFASGESCKKRKNSGRCYITEKSTCDLCWKKITCFSNLFLPQIPVDCLWEKCVGMEHNFEAGSPVGKLKKSFFKAFTEKKILKYF